jgi:hypothetical protein
MTDRGITRGKPTAAQLEEERALGLFVEREVRSNVNDLVSLIIQNGEQEEFKPFTVRPKDFAEEHGWKRQVNEDGQRTQFIVCEGKPTVQSWQEAYMIERQENYSAAIYEIFTWYAVTPWLGEELRLEGEMIVKTENGLCIWGRTSFGGAISMDKVIRDIYHGGPWATVDNSWTPNTHNKATERSV